MTREVVEVEVGGKKYKVIITSGLGDGATYYKFQPQDSP